MERRSGSQFDRLVAGISKYSVVMLDPNGLVISCNEGAQRLNGYSAEEVLGEHCSVFFPPEDVAAGKPGRELADALEKGEIEVEGWRVRKDGSRFLANVVITAVKEPDGTATSFAKVTRDITDWRTETENLRERQQRQIIDGCTTGIVIVGEGGTILDANMEAERLFGYRREELIGVSVGKLVPAVLRQGHAAHVASFFAAPEKRAMGAGRDLLALRKDGSTFPIEIGLSVVSGTEENRVLASIVDLTDRKRTLRQKEDLVAELENKNAEMERFVYTVSHDLKSPLITIKSFVGLAIQDEEAGQKEQMLSDLGRVTRAADRMYQLLEELLKISRVGRSTNATEIISMSRIAHEARELAAGQIMNRGAIVDIAANLPAAMVDRMRMVEVFQNLIDNAVKFSNGAPEPRISIGCQCVDGEKRFFVKDNGIGIDSRYRHKIFGLFEKLDTQSPGAGVGLALVRRIIELHGGRIWVESPGIGSGTTFWFTLGMLDQSETEMIK
jgi:PAS domain S-box-containing protein